MVSLIGFLRYYHLRDVLPFYTLLFYIFPYVTKDRKLGAYLATQFYYVAGAIGLISLGLKILCVPDDTLTGFSWSYIAPMQYSALILITWFLLEKKGWGETYRVAVGWHLASAVGYVYETVYWIFSRKAAARIIHTSGTHMFFFSYQMIAIVVSFWLLKRGDVFLVRKDALLFGIAYLVTFFMASQMYVFSSLMVARVPMILFALHLVNKVKEAPTDG